MTRRLLAAAAALLVALTGAMTVVSYARTADRRALAGQEAVRAFVAEKEVPAGTTAGKAVEEGLMVQKLIARRAVPDGALTAVEPGYDQLVATSTIQPGELVLRARFAARGTTRGTLLVPEGLLAVSLALDDPSHVGSFVTVGSKVAVFDTFNIRETGSGPGSASGSGSGSASARGAVPAGDHLADRHEFVRATRLLLPSVEVLAVGAGTTATPAPTPESEKAAAAAAAAADPMASGSGVTLFTVAVTQAQAELLVHGTRTGTLTFALLGPQAGAVPGRGVDDDTLFEVTK